MSWRQSLPAWPTKADNVRYPARATSFHVTWYGALWCWPPIFITSSLHTPPPNQSRLDCTELQSELDPERPRFGFCTLESPDIASFPMKIGALEVCSKQPLKHDFQCPNDYVTAQMGPNEVESRSWTKKPNWQVKMFFDKVSVPIILKDGKPYCIPHHRNRMQQGPWRLIWS